MIRLLFRAALAWRRSFACAMACTLCLLAPFEALGADHALLIGVSDYPNLPRRLWLRAPGNDVALMREALLAQGNDPAGIHELTSRSGEGREPTRQNIVAAMQALRGRVQPGDRVVFYLAGHGSQQPQPARHGDSPTESDGLDEVFLPADVQGWNGSGSEAVITNALLDDEIGEWIDALVDRGTRVWAVFDTCHAAGMSRGPGQRGSRVRAVDPAELGMPTRAARAATPNEKAQLASVGRNDGRVLAFAARAHEATGEEWLPRGLPLGRNKLHGVFTFHVAQALRLADAPTLRGLEQSVRAAYAAERRSEPTPLFRGDAALRWR